MSQVSVTQIRELRRLTGAGVGECRSALEQTTGHVEQAVRVLRDRAETARQRDERDAREGAVGSYLHHTAKLGVLVEVGCETDFVARTETFQALVRQLAEQIAAAAPTGVDRAELPAAEIEARRRDFAEQARAAGKPADVVDRIVAGRLEAYFATVALLDQPWVREPGRTMGSLVKEAGARLGEKLVVRRFVRVALGEEVGRAGS